MLKEPVSAKDHVQGDPNALLVLVEYGDYQCPACGMAYPIVKQVQQQFGLIAFINVVNRLFNRINRTAWRGNFYSNRLI